jgi:hypothetical protein
VRGRRERVRKEERIRKKEREEKGKGRKVRREKKIKLLLKKLNFFFTIPQLWLR